MIYLPIEEVNDYACFTVYDKDTIRAYYTTPSHNSNSNYTDFYINSNYITKEGNQSWSNFSTLPVCMDRNNITTSYVYRTDFWSILLVFIIMVGGTWFLISKLIKTFFRGFKRY